MFSVLQPKSLDITYCSKEINNLKEMLLSMCNNGFEKLWGETHQSRDAPKKTQKQGSVSTTEDKFKRLYFEIFDIVACQLQS
jgi:hypothetical protein